MAYVEPPGGITRMNIISRLALALSTLAMLTVGCGKQAEAPTATVSWIHPRLSQPTPPVAITNSSALARLPKLFPGYDGPPPTTQPADPPMYDCVIGVTKADGTRSDIQSLSPASRFQACGGIRKASCYISTIRPESRYWSLSLRTYPKSYAAKGDRVVISGVCRRSRGR
jgi:hypothetical protein